MRKKTQEEFEKAAKEKFASKFTYGIYNGNKTKMQIFCPEHGEFWATPEKHLSSIHGCNLCSPTGGALKTKEQVIAKFKAKHADKYNYDKVIFTGVKNKVIIGCPIHGDFKQIAEKHFTYGCSACAGNRRTTLEEFIERANKVFNNKYNYDLVYQNANNWNKLSKSKDKIKIICPKHGEFEQTPNGHLSGRDCFNCYGSSSKKEKHWLDAIGIPKNCRNKAIYLNSKNKRKRKKYIVDGYLPGTNLVFEFLGDFWHGHPISYDHDVVNNAVKRTFKFLFNETVKKIKTLRSFGYKVITIWERDYDRKLKQGKLIYDKFSYCRKPN